MRSDAESMVVASIPTIGLAWSRMRVGVTSTSVYVAPRARGTRDPRFRRPHMAQRLLEPMTAALDRNREGVINEIDDMLEDLGETWERV